MSRLTYIARYGYATFRTSFVMYVSKPVGRIFAKRDRILHYNF